ncbi:disintegrin and metalloproteinase domain-containing protein 10 [Danaus plexippus plexippus]|uniref:Disintegrin and metalloproteinase domain-containing protein 10 n=1 Tax=Danaus plexippus plexippus TaxID=278856 RepID=A0A212FPC2_DANPL|nr:disintegrin and metalloproteinase domain-containing protein 10 [Danaus plexippus plexippus]
MGGCGQRQISSSRRLSEYVEYYEPLEYDSTSIHAQHIRTRRSSDAPHLRISFHAHGRHFHLRLRRDVSAFSPDFKVEGAQGQLHDVDTSHIYQGDLVVARVVRHRSQFVALLTALPMHLATELETVIAIDILEIALR